MTFYGSSFSYNSIPSELFGLKIGELDASAINEMMGSNSVDISEQRTYRNPIPFFYGATAAPKLSFPMTVYSEDEIDASLMAKIQRNYFSSRQYYPLSINQPDLQDIYFNAILKEPRITKVGGLSKLLSFTVECDSPFAWHYPKTQVWTFSDTNVDASVAFNNESDDAGDYLYPSMVMVFMNSTAPHNATLFTSNENSRVMSFTGLTSGEVMFVDCYRKTIISSTGLKRMSNFSKIFLRFTPGMNSLRILGNVSLVQITTQFASKRI